MQGVVLWRQVLEPRRVVAKAAARRMAALLGEAVGQTVGYRVRLDQKVSAATRIEVVTTGVLLRRLLGEVSASALFLNPEPPPKALDALLAR